VYDTATGVSTGAGALFTDLTQTNLKGRLSMASVNGTAATAYSYDTVGRTVSLDECLPSGCGTAAYNKQLQYQYDQAGYLTSSTDGAGVVSTYGVSPANEILSLTSSLSNPTNPENIISSAQYGPNGAVNYTLGNGLSAVYSYDELGRLSGGNICSGSTSSSCAGGTQVYGFTSGWKGSQLQNSSDTVSGLSPTYGYDGFNRLTSLTAGTTLALNYVYDIYGNRLQQNLTAGSGPQPQYGVNTANNELSGLSYDAVGNTTYDGAHTYTYDAENNMTAVDGGTTAQYVFDALNHRVRTVVGGTAKEYVFNANNQRVSVWNGTSHAQLEGQYYSGAKPVAFYSGGAVHFQHQDWLGTERMRTSYGGAVDVEGTFTSLPYGDAQVTTSGTDADAYHFAGLDYDGETSAGHAQFRQYATIQGRWFSADPYSGSYKMGNPQSFNRYTYAMNNPLAIIDPSGLCGGDIWGGSDDCPTGPSNPTPGDPNDDGNGGDDGNTFNLNDPNNIEVSDGQFIGVASSVDVDGAPDYIEIDFSETPVSQLLFSAQNNTPARPGATAAPTAPNTTQQCPTIQANYDRAQMATNAKWWSRGWGSIILGGVAGGPVGAGAGLGQALLYDDDNEELAALTKSYSQQWQQAGCAGALVSRFGR